MEVEIERFEAVSEAGQTYTIVCLQDQIDTSTVEGHATIPMLKRFVTASGEVCSQVDDETFVVAQTNETLRRTSGLYT